MPALPPPVPDERSALLAFLAQQRLAVRVAAYGLTDEQARRAAAPPSTLTVGGLVKHAARTEQVWIDTILEQRDPSFDYADGFVLRPDETLAGALAHYDDVAAEMERLVASIDDLGQAVPVPRDAPWYPQDIDAWSVRWVLLHVIEETARHAGHADIVREALDGATAFPLLAAAEGWPATPWLQPWTPPGSGDAVPA
jgi:uncharacterized damage-inducible protein DinB